MHTMKTFTHLLFATLAAFAMGAQAQTPAPAPASLQRLLNAVPELPATAEQAARWIDKAGRVVHPPLLQAQAALQQHRQAMQRVAAAQQRAELEQAQVGVGHLAQGLQSVGIDLRRMQTDPAYAQQVQERLRRMTPAEQMAVAQRMAQPQNPDPRYVNAAQAMAEDKPAARAAAEAGQVFVQQQPQRFERHAALWAETEAAAQRLRERKLTPGLPKPAMEWDNPACDQACRALWQGYAARMLPLMLARENEILALHRDALNRQRAGVAPDIATADRHLQAAEFGMASTSTANQGLIVGYDSAAVAEIQALLDRTVEAVQRAAVLPHCGTQAVLVPQAVCH